MPTTTETFGAFFDARPQASSVASQDELFLRQGGVSKRVPSSLIVGIGTGGGGGLLSFASISDAQTATIPSSNNNVQVFGYNSAGDNGGGVYTRVNSLTPYYSGLGNVVQVIPPSFSAGGIPVTNFATTFYNHQSAVRYGPTSQPILAGCLTILVIFGIISPPSTVNDDAGNIYTLATSAHGQTGSPSTSPFPYSPAIYYCSNPIYSPIGTTFSFLSALAGGAYGNAALNVYCVPGFTNSVLDQVAVQTLPPGGSVGVTLTTPPLTASQELIFAVSQGAYSPVTGDGVTELTYTLQAGWQDISPPIIGRSVIACYISNNTSPVTFSWSTTIGDQSPSTIIATFKTAPFSSFNPSYWELSPTLPAHTAQFGISPAQFGTNPTAVDNAIAFVNFGAWLTSIAAPSATSLGGAGQASGTCTISIANPAVITLAPASGSVHNLRNGSFISFSTTGQLPHNGGTQLIVPGQVYYVQYGTVTPTSVQISSTNFFTAVGKLKGTSISTLGGSQSGTHYYTVYGQSWTAFVLDPGGYYASNNAFPAVNVGLSKWRASAYGARMQTNFFIDGNVFIDVNANTGVSALSYYSQFQTTASSANQFWPFSVTLNTPAQASNFYVNSWVLLMCNELQGKSSGPVNQSTFEYANVKSVNASTGVITFYDPLQYNYRSTLPKFASSSGLFPIPVGPATIVQLNDTFDQEIELKGLNIYGQTEENFSGVLSVRLVDCDIWGWGGKTGPFPSVVRKFSMEKCRIHNATMEVDKLIDLMEVIECEFDVTSSLQFQSGSVNKVIIDKCRMPNGINGTAKDITVRDSFIAGVFLMGPVYGVTERATLINSHIQSVANANQEQEIISTTTSGITFSGGTIKVASGTTTVFGTWSGPSSPSDCPLPWAVPGGKMSIRAALSTNGKAGVGAPSLNATAGMVIAFTILDVYVDGSNNFCVDTDLPFLPSTTVTFTGTVSGTTLNVASAISPADACFLIGMVITGGGLPANTIITSDLGIPNATSNIGAYTISSSATIGSTSFTASVPMWFLPHPCPRLTNIGCTGGKFVTSQYGAPPDTPLWSYFKEAFNGLPFSAFPEVGVASVSLAGSLTSWTISVPRATAAAGSTYVITMFGWKTSGSNVYPTYVNQTIDVTTSGTRTLSQGSPVGSVGADSLVAVPFWLTGGHMVVTTGSYTLANMPKVIMTAQTDQGVDFSAMVVKTATSGMDLLGDSVTQAAIN